jgi:hypothetical protein
MAEDRPHRRRSHVLFRIREIAAATERDTVKIDDFSTGLGRRGYGMIIFLLNLPNLIPFPLPLLSIILGIPLALVGLQLAIGFKQPWLPGIIRKQGFKKKDILFFCDDAERRYGKYLKLFRPRLPFLTRGLMTRILGLAVAILALVMALPIPLGNLVLAVPIALLALGLAQRDGYFVIAGFGVGILGLTFNLIIGSSIIYAGILAIKHLI